MQYFKAINLIGMIALLFGCAGLQQKKAEPVEKHFIWKAEKQGVPAVWVLGSIHLADSSFYPFPQVIDSALDASTLVAAELAINETETIKKTRQLMVEKGLLPAGTRLKDVIPSSLFRQVDSLSKAWKMPEEILEPFRPWMVAITLSGIAIEYLGFSGDFGIDQEVLARAEDQQKKVFAIETPEEQIGVFSNAKDSLGVEYLQATLNEIAQVDSMVKGVADAWKTGNVQKMRMLLDSDKSEDVYEEELYIKRNFKMAESIDSLASAGEKAFVVIGSAHLIGKGDNVLRILEKKGYKVEQY